MPKKSVRDISCILIVLTVGATSTTLVMVLVRNRQYQIIEFNHHQRLDQISIDGVPHPSPASFDLQSTTPPWMKGVNFVLQARSPVLAKKYRSLDFALSTLPFLNGESNFFQGRPQYRQNAIASEALF